MKDQAQAHAKYLRISPFKIRRIANLIRGKKATEAVSILRAMPHKAATFLEKALKSAVANAKQKDLIENELFVTTLMVNEGARLKRFQPRARGRMFQITKPTSHILIGVGQTQGGSSNGS